MTFSRLPSPRALRQRSKVFSGVENSGRGAGIWKVMLLIFSLGILTVWPCDSTEYTPS